MLVHRYGNHGGAGAKEGGAGGGGFTGGGHYEGRGARRWGEVLRAASRLSKETWTVGTSTDITLEVRLSVIHQTSICPSIHASIFHPSSTHPSSSLCADLWTLLFQVFFCPSAVLVSDAQTGFGATSCVLAFFFCVQPSADCPQSGTDSKQQTVCPPPVPSCPPQGQLQPWSC